MTIEAAALFTLMQRNLRSLSLLSARHIILLITYRM
jgi:hypothetical protein